MAISGLRYKSQTSCSSSRKRRRFDRDIHNQRAHEACHRSTPGHQPLTEKFCIQQKPNSESSMQLPVTWLNTIWLNFFVESFGLKILSQVTTKVSQLHSNSRNKYVNSRKYHNVGHMRCMHARPHRRKDQLPLGSLRDLRSR